MIFLYVLLVAVFVFIAGLFFVDMLIAAPPYKGDSPHFNGQKFVNPHHEEEHHYLDVLRWWFSGNDKGVWQDLNEKEYPVTSVHKIAPRVRDLQVTFINHSTFLLQFDGMNILTDPIWSLRASPYQWIGPKRMRPPGMKFEELPPINLVLLTHNHYDHLDLATLQRLRSEHDPDFVVPLGVERLLYEHGIGKVTNLDWSDRHVVSEKLVLTAVRAQHFSGRGLFDRNKTLWCGYVLHSSLGNIYYAGDTGYGAFFKEIGEQFGPMYASFIPIGAYKPKWFMSPIHISPEQALKVHHDVQSQHSFAMHFGTFPLADDGMYDSPERLAELKQQKPLEHPFEVLTEGKTTVIPAQNHSRVTS